MKPCPMGWVYEQFRPVRGHVRRRYPKGHLHPGGRDEIHVHGHRPEHRRKPYDFSGVLTDSEFDPYAVGGDSRVTVGTPTVRPTPTSTSTPTPDSGRPSRSTPSNRRPVFDEGSETSRSVVENAPSGTAVGDAITASDSDDDDIEYSLIGVDRRAFDVGVDTGQITVAEGTSLDFESKSTYSVSMRASDPAGGRNTISRHHHDREYGRGWYCDFVAGAARNRDYANGDAERP